MRSHHPSHSEETLVIGCRGVSCFRQPTFAGIYAKLGSVNSFLRKELVESFRHVGEQEVFEVKQPCGMIGERSLVFKEPRLLEMLWLNPRSKGRRIEALFHTFSVVLVQ